MALKSVYYDGPVTESDRAENRAGAPDYGVYGPEDFKVTAHPSIPYAVLVKKGRAHGHGVTDEAEEDQIVQCASLSSGVRWDLIVVRRNWQPALGGPSTLEALQAGSAPEIPTTRKKGPGVEDDQPIFLVKWQGGTSAPVDFVDLRVWAGNGGLYAKSDLVRTYLDAVGTRIRIQTIEWASVLDANGMQTWAKLNARRHARLTATTAGNAGVTGPGVEWGFSAFKDATPSTSENTFATPGPESKIRLTPGMYSVVAKGRSETSPGYYYVSIKNDTNNYTFGDGRTDGDWGATAMAIITLDATANILLGHRTGNGVRTDVTVDIVKVSD